MIEIFDLFTRYSTIILAVITGVYAYLTWRMVREMRSARENQADANVIAYPVPLGPVSAQVQLQNTGPGPALEVEISLSLRPLVDTPRRTWRHPALLVNQKEHFLLPGVKVEALRDLAEKHEDLLIELSWKNIFGKHRSVSESHDLRQLAEGWYKAGHLIPPGDLLTQTKDIREELNKITKTLESIARTLPK